MRDVRTLRARIRRAALLLPLALPAGACARETPYTAQCPSSAFCATSAQMAAFAASASPTSMDCPTNLALDERTDTLPGMPRHGGVEIGLDPQATAAARTRPGAQAMCCYAWGVLCPGGRPLVDDRGATVVASACRGAGWSRHAGRLGEALAPDLRARVAQEWLADALSEHASIASFARTTLELLAVGAPAALVRESVRAGLDEVSHAERCFELARAYDGVAREPAPLEALAPRPASLDRLARDTFVEGCVGETISALCAMRAAEAAPPGVAKTWRLLAKDEGRHAALAWRTLAWVFQQTEPGTAPGLVGLAERLAGEALAAPADGWSDAAAEGRLSARAIAETSRSAWRDILLPTLREMAGETILAA